MHFENDHAAKELLAALLQIPPNLATAEKILRMGGPSAVDVTLVGATYLDECFCDATDLAAEPPDPPKEEIVPGLHSTYLYPVMELLLRYGLEPCRFYDDDLSIVGDLSYVNNEYIAADVLDLFLRSGASMDVPDQFGTTLFEELDYDVFFDAFTQRERQNYAALVHLWMVAVGHGARYKEGNGTMKFFREFDSEAVFDSQKLKNHRDYTFGVLHLDGDIALSIYDRKTFCEVLRAF